MKRVLAVVLLAAVTAVLSGFDETSLAASVPAADSTEAHRAEITKSLKGAKIGGAVKIRTQDGTKIKGRLMGVTPDAITVQTGKGQSTETKTVLINDIKEVSKGHKTRNIVLITTGVLLGSCILAATTYDEGHTPPKASPPTPESPRQDPALPPSGPPQPPVDSPLSMPQLGLMFAHHVTPAGMCCCTLRATGARGSFDS